MEKVVVSEEAYFKKEITISLKWRCFLWVFIFVRENRVRLVPLRDYMAYGYFECV